MKIIFILLLATWGELTTAEKHVNWGDVRARSVIPLSRPARAPGRIVGGEVATRGQIPYQAGVISDGQTFCAGAILSDTVVVTAAHCVDRFTSYEVHLGADFIYNYAEEGHVVVTSHEVILHPDFQGSVNFNNDLAIVQLPQPVTGKYIAPVQLPARSQLEETFEDVVARTSGWGVVDDISPYLSEQLRFVDVEVTSLVTCQGYYGSQVVTACHVCASTNSGTEGICTGDAGAPLVYEDQVTGERTLIGLASWGSPFGCRKDEPNIYVRMTCYVEWIKEATGISVRP